MYLKYVFGRIQSHYFYRHLVSLPPSEPLHLTGLGPYHQVRAAVFKLGRWEDEGDDGKLSHLKSLREFMVEGEAQR
jgi:hypothetical protein